MRILAFVLAFLLFLRSRLFFAPRLRTSPRLAAPKRASDCSLPAFPPGVAPPNAAAPPVALNGPIARGFITGSTITVPAGSVVRFPDALTLVAFGDVTIDGQLLPGNSMPGAPSFDLVIVSLQGNIIVGAQGIIQEGIAAEGVEDDAVAPNAVAVGGPGTAGGFTKLVAPRGSIVIDGELRGQGGGMGGKAVADPNLAGIRLIGGSAAATGGQGGEGGDVRLCALETIRVNGLVAGGWGGYGGAAVAYGKDGENAEAEGGPANDAGWIFFHGLGPQPVSVIVTGTVQTANGGWGGDADAFGGSGNGTGGDALAIGGDGGTGASVMFVNAVVVPPIATIQSSLGGDGGWADALGGNGANAIVASGFRGGNGVAQGGRGGRAGAPNPPVLPTPGGNVAGTPGAAGPWAWCTSRGGDATAWGGNGGAGAATPIGNGGASGTGTARTGVGGVRGGAPPGTTSPSAPGGPAPSGAGGLGTSTVVRGIP